jgi:hypothetical protein
MSTLKSINVQHPSATTTNIVNDASGNVAVGNNLTVAGTSTLTGNVTAAGTVAMGSSFKRNRIINGNMLIDQRNAGASVTPTTDGTYTLDRWAAGLSASSKYSVQQSSTAPTGFINSALITSLSSYSVPAGGYFAYVQSIEGLNVADLGWGTASAQTVTLSFWVRSSLTGTFGGSIQNSAQNRSYPFTYTIGTANTWEQKSVTIAGDTSGTWLTTNGVGLSIKFGLGVGSTYSGTTGAWAGAQYFSATGAVSVVGTNAATWYVTGVQLEVGTKATPYEMQIYSDQLAQCQRYFEVGGITSVATNVYQNTCWFKVQKRAIPTLTLVAGGLGGATLSAMNALDYGGVIAGVSGFRQNGASSGAIDAVISVSAEL